MRRRHETLLESYCCGEHRRNPASLGSKSDLIQLSAALLAGSPVGTPWHQGSGSVVLRTFSGSLGLELLRGAADTFRKWPAMADYRKIMKLLLDQ